MKKTFSLLTLLLLLCSSAWGETVDCSGASATSSTGNTNKSTSTNYSVYFTRGGGGWGVNSSKGYQGKADAIAVFKLSSATDVKVIISNSGSSARTFTMTAKPFKTVALGDEFLSILEVSYSGPYKYADCVSPSKNYAELETTSAFYNTAPSTYCTLSNSQLSTSISYTTGEQDLAASATSVEYTFDETFPAGVYAVGFSAVSNSNVSLAGFIFSTPAPTITTQPVGASYVTGQAISALTVAATASKGSLTYQWYSCDDAEKANAEEIDGATSASYTPTGAGFYYVDVTDGNGTTTSDVVEITVSAASAPESISVMANATSVYKNADVTLTASVTGGVPTPTIHWYSCTNAEKAGASEIVAAQGEETYSPSTAALGTYYFYAVASNGYGDDVSSDVVTITVNGHTDCELTNIKFSNGAYGAIGTLSDGAATITVPYLSGESAPSINESSIVISATATKSIDGNTIIVTAEDGTTTGTYTITKTAFTPLAVTGNVAATDFTDVPSWAFNPYGYEASKGVKFAKAVDEASNMRIAKGNTRQYYFIGAAKTLTLTKKGTTRKVNVYVNGTKVINDTNNDALGAIALNESAPCMVMIESYQTSGDGGFASYAIAASENVTATVGTAGWATFSSNYQLDFTGKTVNAYIITGVNGSNVVTVSQVYKVPANTGLLLSGTTDDIPVATGETDNVDGNELVAGDGSLIDGASNKYVLANQAQGVGFYTMEDDLIVPCGKAYLVHGTGGGAPSVIRIVDEENNATSIKAINADNNAVKFIENGTLYILREGVVYDALGRMVR